MALHILMSSNQESNNILSLSLSPTSQIQPSPMMLPPKCKLNLFLLFPLPSCGSRLPSVINSWMKEEAWPQLWSLVGGTAGSLGSKSGGIFHCLCSGLQGSGLVSLESSPGSTRVFAILFEYLGLCRLGHAQPWVGLLGSQWGRGWCREVNGAQG